MSTESRHVAIVISPGGMASALKLKKDLGYKIYATKPHVMADEVAPFKALVERAFKLYQGIVFFSSLGIVVRAITPHVQSKFDDPAVVCIDDAAHFVIAVLSGHVGGANLWCQDLARYFDAQAVVTTATDRLGVTGLDLILEANGVCARHYRQEILRINARLVAGQTPVIYTDKNLVGPVMGYQIKSTSQVDKQGGIWWAIDSPPFDMIWIQEPHLTLGLGLRRGKSLEALEEAIGLVLKQEHVTMRAIARLATIELKAQEEGVIALARKYKLPLQVVTLEAIKAVQADFEGSDFVEATLGVRAVSQPCAYVASGNMTVSKRYAHDGVTVSIGGLT